MPIAYLLLLALGNVPHPAVASAYSYTGHRTATGEWPRAGRTCAVRHGLSMRRWYWIHGRLWWANDRMPKNGRDFDLCLSSRHACDRWGVRRVWVK
jgi:hypothetical protein